MPPAVRRIPLAVRAAIAGACLLAPGAPALARGDAPEQALDMRTGAPLPPDGRVLAGSLRNGVSYIIRRHDTPARHVSIRMHVRAGSLHEAPDAPGAAGLVARLAFSASEGFAPGQAIASLRERGIGIDRVENVRVGMSETVFALEVPSSNAEDVLLALRFLSDAASSPSFDAALVEKERRLAIDEQRIRLGASQRLSREMLRRLFPGSSLGEHPPEGTPRSIGALTIDQLRSFHAAHYRPGDITVVCVGDAPERRLLDLVDLAFGAIPAPAPGAAPAPGIALADEDPGRAVVATDEDFAFTFAEILRVDGPESPVRTERDLRRSILDDLAVEALRQRLVHVLHAEPTPFVEVFSESTGVADVVSLRAVAVQGARGSWDELVRRLVTEVRRVHDHPLSGADIELARRAIVTRAVRAARSEPGAPSADLAEACLQSVRARSTLVAPRDVAALTAQFASLPTDEAVTERCRELFDLSQAHVVVVAPSGGDAPDGAKVTALVKETAAQPTDAPGERAPTMSLLEGEPAPGVIDEIHVEALPGVITMRCANNVVVHHREMADATGRVRIVATLAGGRIDEDEFSRGLTEAASASWWSPASCEVSGDRAAAMLESSGISLVPRVLPGRVSLAISCDAEDAEQAARLLHMLLTDPVIEPGAFDRWRERASQEAAARSHVPYKRLRELFYDEFFLRSDPRHRPLLREEIDAIDPALAQRWLDEISAGAPLEVAIVGAIDRPQVARLVAVYLASLPSRRALPGDVGVRASPAPPTPSGARRFETMEAQTDQAALLIGFRVDDGAPMRERIALDLARRVLEQRLRASMQERTQLASQVSVGQLRTRGYRDAGLVYAFALCVPDRAGRAMDAMRRAMDALVVDPPSEDELGAARAAALHEHRAGIDDQRFWSDMLGAWELDRSDPEEVTGFERAVASIDRDEIARVLARCNAPARRIEIGVAPERRPEEREHPPAGRALRNK